MREDIVWTNSGRYNFIGPTKAKFLWYVDNNKEIGGRNAKYKIRVSCAFVLAADANWM